MIHATIQYTQTDKSRNCFDLSKDSWLYFCISLEAAAICDEGLATKSQSYKREGLGSDPEMGWVGWEGHEKKLLEISTWYSFPEIPDIFTPSRQFMLGKGRTSSKKKTMT